uniref:Putative primase n=1 Tax=viral metagenome TaxID=1070528 RepID=A0A6H1Z9J3_9ZZZZ
MLDIQTLKAQYDCRLEVEKCLGKPKYRTAQSWAWNCWLHDDREPSMHVYANHYNCFGCGEHGDVLDFFSYWRKQPLADVLRGEGFDPKAITERAAENAARVERELALRIQEAQAALAELRSARKWEQYHENLTETARQAYRTRGIPDWYQDWCQFGYCDDFRVWFNDQEYHTPTLTLPIFESGWNCVNIRHRLLNPPNDSAGNKYRPEKSGLGVHPFLADPDKKPNHEHTLVVEGEIKAAVSFVTLDSDKWQVVGLPGKTPKKELCEQLVGGHVVVCLDPDAQKKDTGGKDAYERLSEKMGCRLRAFFLPEKIDDLIVAGAIDKGDLRQLINQARVIRR